MNELQKNGRAAEKHGFLALTRLKGGPFFGLGEQESPISIYVRAFTYVIIPCSFIFLTMMSDENKKNLSQSSL